MVKCSLQTISYVAGAVQLVISLIVGIMLIVTICVQKDGQIDENWDFITRHMTIIWSLIVINVVTFFASTFLFRAIKTNNYKCMMFFVVSVAFVAGLMLCLSIDGIIANSKKHSFGTAVVKTLDDIVFGVIEFIVAFIVDKYRLQVKADRWNRHNQREMQELHGNGYKTTDLQS